MKILHRYSPLADRDRPQRNFIIKKKDGKILNPDVVSQTKQSDRDMSDINFIVAKAQKTGLLGDGMPATRQAQYGDFTGADDYLTQQNNVLKFKSMFDALSPEVRTKFRNDPAELLKYVNNPANREEGIELGLFPKPVITRKKIQTPEGKDVILHLKDGVEFDREDVKPPKVEGSVPPQPEA